MRKKIAYSRWFDEKKENIFGRGAELFTRPSDAFIN